MISTTPTPYHPLAGLRREGVERENAKSLKISHVSSDDGQVVNGGGRRDHRVFDQTICPTMHQPRPDTESLRVHAQDIVGPGDLLQPSLNRGCLGLVPFARDFDARLDLSDR